MCMTSHMSLQMNSQQPLVKGEAPGCSQGEQWNAWLEDQGKAGHPTTKLTDLVISCLTAYDQWPAFDN